MLQVPNVGVAEQTGIGSLFGDVARKSDPRGVAQLPGSCQPSLVLVVVQREGFVGPSGRLSWPRNVPNGLANVVVAECKLLTIA